MSETLNLPPDPARTIEGLRDTGYEFNTAVADIIDNSITAQATTVDVRIEMDFRGDVRVSIADDGTGMDRTGLENAMKYGSKRGDDPASLGKFGLGLKTASTAFCRRLSVLSRADGSSPVLQATWDLDHVVKVSAWELQLPEPDSKGIEHLDLIASDQSGTVVVWEKVDRLFVHQYQRPGGAPARKALERRKERLLEHIGMVYQRYLDHDDKRAPNIQIRLDGQIIEGWDPYCEKLSTLVAKNESVEVDLPNGSEASFSIRAFVLLRRDEFPDTASRDRAKIENSRQGIYIYRENRLIHDADWLGMFQKEPHFSLLRVEFSFDHHLDVAFNIDIKKSRIRLNEDLWQWLRNEFLPAPRRAAEQSYRQGTKMRIIDKSKSAHDSSNRSIASKEEELKTAEVSVLDADSGEVQVTNTEGTVRLKLKVSSTASKPGQCFVDPVDGIDDGMLWEPCLIENHKAVRINQGHPYYEKVYVPNLVSGVTVQGMDSLLWALCAAEFGTVNNATKRHFQELRFQVSRLLRTLVDELPEPSVENDDEPT